MPAYLINATVQEMGSFGLGGLAAFSRIWVRETRSAEYLAQHSIEAAVCGDMSFAAPMPEPTGENGILVLDSMGHHKRRTHKALGEIARHEKARFVSMKYDNGGPVRVRRWWPRSGYRKTGKPLGGVTNFDDFAAFMGLHSHLVTGRYHGLCFAMNMGLPFSVMPSNTWKCEALVEDAGFNADRIFNPGDAPCLRPFSDIEREAATAYSNRVRASIGEMFDTIFAPRAKA